MLVHIRRAVTVLSSCDTKEFICGFFAGTVSTGGEKHILLKLRSRWEFSNFAGFANVNHDRFGSRLYTIAEELQQYYCTVYSGYLV